MKSALEIIEILIVFTHSRLDESRREQFVCLMTTGNIDELVKNMTCLR